MFKKNEDIKKMDTNKSNKELREELAQMAQRFASLGEQYAEGLMEGAGGPRDKCQNVARMWYRLSMQAEYTRRALLYLAQSKGELVTEEDFMAEREASFLVGHDSHDALKRLEGGCVRRRNGYGQKKERYKGGFKR